MPHHEVTKTKRINAKRLRKDMTDAERLLWQELRAHRLMGLSFRRQLPVGKYIVDFACPQQKLIIELDGGGHSEDAQMRHDAVRTKFLETEGWTVIRFWNDEVTNNLSGACDHILGYLAEKGVVFQ